MARGRITRFCSVLTLALVALLTLVPVTGIHAASEATLSGTVFGAQDVEPLAGINLLLENDSRSFVTVTADDGSYSFFDIPAGDYTLSVDDPDFISVPIGVALAAGAYESLDLAAVSKTIFDVSSMAGAVAPKAINTSGKWTGSYRATGGSTGGISMNIIQSGKSIHGKMTVTRTDCGTVSFLYKGAINGTSVSLNAMGSCYGAPVTLKIIKGKLVSRTRIRGNFKLYLQPGAVYASGTFAIKKK
jgi:hypothetical protein